MEMHDNLIKAILKYVEKNGKRDIFIDMPEVHNFTEDQVSYHLDLCEQAGFITAERTMGGIYPGVLTYRGQMELRRLRA